MLCNLFILSVNDISKVLMMAEKSKPDPFEFSTNSLYSLIARSPFGVFACVSQAAS
jgi:hypothetical protein